MVRLTQRTAGSRSRRWGRLAAVPAALALVMTVAQPASGTPASGPEEFSATGGVDVTQANTGLWFVEFASPPTADGTSHARLGQERAAFRSEAARAGLRFQERRNFETLWNGISVRIDPTRARDLAELDSVRAIYPVETVPLPETPPQTSPEMATALAMTGADVAQSELGLTGKGVRVAVMDTGIDYNHPDLGGCFGPSCRVVTGWDFVGDDFNSAVPPGPPYPAPVLPTPQPGPDPMDCHGHGTHVAGIIGAEAAEAGGVTGVAPEVTFGAYKVFGCTGSTTADIMVAAMERALADKMDILNMSIGSAFSWPQYPTAQASDRLVKRGMVVVASIGNSGANGVYGASAPGLGKDVIGVASFDNTHINAQVLELEPGGEQVAYQVLGGATVPPTSGTTPEIVWLGRGCVDTLDDELLGDPTGRVGLLVRGDCTFDEKYQAAVDAGAVAVVIHNHLPGLFAGGGIVDRGVPGAGISLADGLALRERLDAGEPVTITWTDETTRAPNPTGGLISNFSSYGLAPDLTLKPDLGAPGGLIYSTYPLARGGYATLGGTSMSSPHVAGAAALLLERHPKTRASAVRDILQNTADPMLWSGNPGLGYLEHVHRQGAGMIDIPAALGRTTAVTPAKLSLGENERGRAVTKVLTVRNTSRKAVTYTFGHEGALSTTGSTFTPSVTTGFADVRFLLNRVTVRAGGVALVPVQITPNAELPDRSQYGGYLVVTGTNDEVTRVPYAGFKGDYQSIQVLTDIPGAEGTVIEMPALAQWEGDGPVIRREATTYTLVGTDAPILLVHLDHQVRRLQVTVRDAATGRELGRAIDLEYVGRNSTPTALSMYAWDGTMTRGKREVTAPDGSYVLELRVLKALGNPLNPAHWESWTSPTVTLARP